MISFIVQGPVESATQMTVDSIREFFPDSEIILATTNKGRNILNVDKIYDAGYEEDMNVNKQILSSQAVNEARFDISFKIRSDIIFTGKDGIMEFIEKKLLSATPPKRLPKYKLFSRFVLASNYHFCNPYKSGFYYCPSDWIALGLTEDLKTLYNIPLQVKEENEYILPEKIEVANVGMIEPKRMKYRPEQYIFVKALQQKGFDISLDYEYQVPDDPESALKWMINNFQVIDTGKDFFCRKYPFLKGPNGNLINEDTYRTIHNVFIGG